MEKIKLKFYEVERCGYYKYGQDGCYLTSLSDVLNDLKEWIQGKTLQQTKTTNILSASSEKLPVYCVGITKGSGNTYLLVTWNEIASTNSNVSSIKKDEPVSSAAMNVESTPLPVGNIPGFATYFWFIPDENILATIKFNHIENGHIGMNYFLKGFLTRFSKYTVLVEDEQNRGNYEIVGYGTHELYDENLHPYFTSKLKRLAGKIDTIRRKRLDITKIIRKTVLSNQIRDDISLWEKLMYTVGISRPSQLDDTVELKYEIKSKPTSQELEDIISSWQQDHSQVWDDVGFTFAGMQNPLWLSSEVPSKDIEINVSRSNDEFVNFGSLISELESKREELQRVYSGVE